MKGLGRIGDSGSSSGRDQILKTRMASVLAKVGIVAPINILGVVVYSSGSSPVYDVELDSFVTVSALLKEFYKFTRRRDPIARPPELDGVSLYRSVTTGTRVRVSLLRVSYLSTCFHY